MVLVSVDTSNLRGTCCFLKSHVQNNIVILGKSKAPCVNVLVEFANSDLLWPLKIYEWISSKTGVLIDKSKEIPLKWVIFCRIKDLRSHCQKNKWASLWVTKSMPYWRHPTTTESLSMICTSGQVSMQLKWVRILHHLINLPPTPWYTLMQPTPFP